MTTMHSVLVHGKEVIRTIKLLKLAITKLQAQNIVGGEQRNGLGEFHVLLRKENGVWKILMDADANEKTDETVFLSGQLMQ
jgi:hypothetical protein